VLQNLVSNGNSCSLSLHEEHINNLNRHARKSRDHDKLWSFADVVSIKCVTVPMIVLDNLHSSFCLKV
jgi:hypothetical protein